MENSSDERLKDLLDGFLAERPDSAPVRLGAMPLADYMEQCANELPDQPESPEDSAIRSKTETLLDSFLAKSPTERQPGFKVSADGDDDDELSDDEVVEVGQKELDNAFFTETLARIYLKQRRYEKALEIISSLYLNFPNKSIYFADQIRYLDLLIRINQKTE